MQRFGFDHSFVNWTQACIGKAWIALLVNGRATGFFQASQGLRKGCPLSPLLYSIQAPMLSFQLDQSQQIQELMGLCIARGVRDINHAQFVDDTILLGSASNHSAKKLKSELDRYQAILASKINYRKSQIYGWNCTLREMTDITQILGIMRKT